MKHYKHACPNCGQHIDYTEGYAGREMPCPICQHPLLFPALGPSQNLEQNLSASAPNRFNFSGIGVFLREFKHWKIVGLCVVPFVLLAVALVAASQFGGSGQAPATAPTEVVVDPQALHQLTDLTRADMVVQDKLAAVQKAFDACAAARRNHAGTVYLQRCEEAYLASRKAFDRAFADYQKLGGAVDYSHQLPAAAVKGKTS